MPDQFQVESSNEHPTHEKTTKKNWKDGIGYIINTALYKANENSSEYKNDTELRSRQRKIIKSLPENFIEELTAHLKAVYIDQAKYPDFKPNPNSDKGFLSGEIFERLIEAEDDTYHLDPNWQEYPQTGEQKETADQILEIMANPERFGLDRTRVRNPDKLKLYFENGGLVIVSSLEAKKHLDSRSLYQLNNFQTDFETTSDYLNTLSEAESHGLKNIGIGQNQISLSKSYRQLLAIPRNSNIDLIVSKNLTSKKRRELIELINDPSKVTIVNPSFSHEELEVLTEYFLKEVENKIRTEATNEKLDLDAESASK